MVSEQDERKAIAKPGSARSAHYSADLSASTLNSKRRNSQQSGDKKKPQLEELDAVSVKSEEYVYKSPSKMTSPEKKAFS